jgi:hypothetical protein
MQIFNAEEQRFAEEKRREQHDDSPFLCENSAVSAFKKNLKSRTELQIQHQLLGVGHGDAVLLDRF